jgi:hypothetical protein
MSDLNPTSQQARIAWQVNGVFIISTGMANGAPLSTRTRHATEKRQRAIRNAMLGEPSGRLNADTLPAIEAHWLTEFGSAPLEYPLCWPAFQQVARRCSDVLCLQIERGVGRFQVASHTVYSAANALLDGLAESVGAVEGDGHLVPGSYFDREVR